MTFSVYQYSNFVGQELTATGLTTLATVPASTQWMIKDIEVCNTDSVAVTITLNLNGIPIFSSMSIPPNQTVHWTGLRVLAATQTIAASCSVANELYISIDGQTGN